MVFPGEAHRVGTPPHTTSGALVAFVGAAAYQAAVSPSVSQGKPVLGVLIPRSMSLRMAAFCYPLLLNYSRAFSPGCCS